MIFVKIFFISLLSLTYIQDSSSKEFKIPYAQEALSNPYKGFYTSDFTKYSKTSIPQSLAYSSFTWRELEGKKRNSFDWKEIEKDWKFHTSRGRHIIIRFKIADPWTKYEKDYPLWLEKFNIGKKRYFIDHASGYVPDWNSEKFLKEHERVIKKLGERYNHDPRIAWIELGSYGIWGEWHMHNNRFYQANFFSKIKIINAYIKAFPDKKLVILFDDPQALKYMANIGSGIRNDCLGSPEANHWFEQTLMKAAIYDFNKIYKKNFIVGEFCGGEKGAKRAIKYHYKENLFFIKKYHWSSIGPAGGSFLKEKKKSILILHKALGYRFYLKSSHITSKIEPNENLNINLNLHNLGVAPFYYNWKTKIYIKDKNKKVVFEYYLPGKSWSPRSWHPGKHELKTSLPIASLGLKPGDYKVFIALEDQHLNLPNIKFANKIHDNNYRYYIGQFKIIPYRYLN